MKIRELSKCAGLMTAALLCALLRSTAGSSAGQVSERAAAPQSTVTFTAVADVTLKSWQPGANFGSEQTLQASHSEIDSPESAVMFLRFDVSSLPATAIIDSANLELYLESSSGLDPVGLGIYYVNDAWTESGVTWNTAPTVATMGLNWQVDSALGYKSHGGLDSWVSDWMAGSNNGVMVYGPLSGDFYQRLFESRERGANVPRLVVTYHLPAVTFSGYVYEGDVGNESVPLSGVTVELYGSNTAGDVGTWLTSTTTSLTGQYALSTSETCEFYNILETDLTNYASVGATTISGTVINNSWVQYAFPLDGKSLNGIKFWDNPAGPLQITSRPSAVNIGPDSAAITWGTDSAGDSVVSYGSNANGYSAQQADATMTISHSVTLSALTPSTTYRFIVVSADAGGSVVTSTDQLFTTLPAPDDTDPTATILVPETISGTTIIRATAGDNNGISRVELSLGDQLVFTDYTPPYEFSFDSTLYTNNAYLFKAKAFDLSGRSFTAQRDVVVANIVDKTLPVVTITSPAHWATVSGKVPVTVSVSDDEALDMGYFWVGTGTSVTPTSYYASWWIGSSKPFPKQATTEIQWNTQGSKNGPLRIAWQVYDKQGNVGWGYQDVIVDNPLPPSPPELLLTNRNVIAHSNLFTVSLTVKNAGGQAATAVTIWDYLQLFQPIDHDDSLAAYQSDFDPNLTRWSVKIQSHVDIPAGEERTFVYEAVPVMTPESAGPYASCPHPMIGAYGVCMSTGWKWEGDTHMQYKQPGGVGYFHEWVQAGKLIPGTTYFGATTQADYLIVTHPGRLFSFNPGQSSDVNALLSDMAELAKLKKGVLGFLAGSNDDALRSLLKNLIKPGVGWQNSNWAYRLHPNFSQAAAGYLLLVGETEIIPAWHTTGWDRHWYCSNPPNCPVTNDVFYSDGLYADTYGDGAPELIVGRIVGDTPDSLANALRTSISVYEGQPGFGFDRSNALLVSGIDSGPALQAEFVDTVNALSTTLAAKGIVVDAFHSKDIPTSQRLPQFITRARDQDVIEFFGHGNLDIWDPVLTSGDFPINFGNANPFALALSCLTGDYEGGDDYNIAEAFLDSRAAIYIGATELSPGPENSEAGKKFFKVWGASESIGQAFTELKRDLWGSDKWWQFWVTEYNLYGDPKYGAAPGGLAAAQAPRRAAQPATSIDVVIPDYTTFTRDGLDHVEIPDGDLVLQENKPQVPSYDVMVDYAPGYQVQDVSLISRSSLSTTTGLSLPVTMMYFNSAGSAPAQSTADAGWFPDKDYDWRLLENPDGSTRLIITLYPFFYDAATTEARFYKNYTLNISVTVSTVMIGGALMDKDAYRPGDPVSVSLQFSNTGTARDVLVSTVIKHYGTDETIDGLPLKTLDGLSGAASFTPQWDSQGKAPGQYYVEVTAQDTAGNVLDRHAERFGLGVSAGQITHFTATPPQFSAGDEMALSMTFSNTGSVSITGTAMIRVQSGAGAIVWESQHPITNLAAGSAITVNDTWDTTGAATGAYTALGYVSYDGMVTEPQVLTLYAGTCIYLPSILR